jgi:hypothetical protein
MRERTPAGSRRPTGGRFLPARPFDPKADLETTPAIQHVVRPPQIFPDVAANKT